MRYFCVVRPTKVHTHGSPLAPACVRVYACSYYSLKETSEQSHRALHKVVVAYAGTLKQLVKPVIDTVSDSQADTGARRARASIAPPLPYPPVVN